MKKKFAIALTVFITVMFSACGTLFKPVPKAPGSELDVSVVVVDSVLVLLGILPGVFAFIVDYKTGALYINGGKKGKSFALNDLSDENIKKILESEGFNVDLDTIKKGRENYFSLQSTL